MNVRHRFFLNFAFLFFVFNFKVLDGKWVDESVWSDKLGEELWSLSNLITKHTEIKSKYTSLNATVIDGKTLLNDIKDNVAKMLQRKISAVRCIANEAEELRRNFYYMNDFKLEYYSMKYSFVEDSDYHPKVPWPLESKTEYKNMTLTKNPNFYNIPVNTEYSAVHIPTNVYDRYRHLAETIMWSEDLNRIFLKNYNSDPALSWQYFGSAHGMMRQYPAMQWNTEDEVDLYDCRTRPWFVEAATCMKDIIILMDNSGSMTGMRNTIAKLVVNSLLKTFGNNDFINVLKFSWKAEPVLSCFKDRLAQATPETIRSFMEAVSHVKPEGNASFPNAFAYSLSLLEKYREQRKCGGGTGGCNQGIMLVTDGLPGNVTEVFEIFNTDSSGIPPVRVFTFLVGTEVKGVQELKMMACRNRGYFVHIHDLDEVHDQVLKYIPVIAKPLVLQGNEHPVIWTHIFADVNDPKLAKWLWKVMKNDEQENRLLRQRKIKAEYFSMQREDSKYVQRFTQKQGEERIVEHQEYRLMTSVSIPAFDRKETNESTRAELLGVAGTDISIDHIYSLTYPYKTGANGYAFIVTNNGYLLMHPDLRPVYSGTLKLNFDSIDLAEVEFLDDALEYKAHNEDILEIRKSMVDQKEEEYLEKIVKFHYDDMQRVGIEKRNYYVTPLPGTPFSIGLVLPSNFVDYRIKSYKVGDGNSTDEEISVDRYLKMKNDDVRDLEWKVHPDWVYCKYHYPSYMSFNSSEEELLHFLEKMKEPDWEWNEQYPNLDYLKDQCDLPEVQESSYYCDRDLMELLMVDAKILESFRDPRIPKNSFETKLLDTYNPNLRFVATQSGLTKWQLVPKPLADESVESDFINAFSKSVDEPWYKMAVLQNHVDEESFVFSIPFKAQLAEEINVIATHAIFHKKTQEGKKAPAAVLGYKFEQASFYDRFMEITSETDKFTLPCSSDARECFLLDHNAYIIVSSREVNETGKFFGEFEPHVMNKMIELGIYEEKLIYDYQALCMEDVAISNDASFLLTPLYWGKKLFHYIFIDFLWNVLQLVSFQTFDFQLVYSRPNNDDDDSKEFRDYDSDEDISIEDEYELEEETFNATIRIERNSWPCDTNKTLYLLKQNIFSDKHIYGIRVNSSRFRFADRVPHTNLILVVINTLYSDFGDIELSVEPNTLPPEECKGSNVMDLPRRRPANCITHHVQEVEVERCGKGSHLQPNLFIILGLNFCIKHFIRFLL